jgi:hypothetical protein
MQVTPMLKVAQCAFSTGLGARNCNTFLSSHAHLSKESQNKIQFCVVSNAVTRESTLHNLNKNMY